MDDPGYSAIDYARVWLRTHWQLIAAPLLTLAIIAGASMWLRPKARPSGPVNIDNPAGVVEGQPYEPHIDPAAFSTTVDNPFYPLIPGTTGTFREGNVAGRRHRDRFDPHGDGRRDRRRARSGIRGDRLIEDTEDWFAQDGEDNVWYFGDPWPNAVTA